MPGHHTQRLAGSRLRGLSILSVLVALFASVLVAPQLTTAHPSAPSPRIIGGVPSAAPPGALVRLYVTQEQVGYRDTAYCGGTLVAPTIVLTAAHCTGVSQGRLGYFEMDRIDVFAGGRDLTAVDAAIAAGATAAAEGAVPAERWTRHPGFQPFNPFLVDRSDDVALVFLERPITGVAPMPIAGPAEASLWAAGTPATMFGYGTTVPDRDEPSSVPLTAVSPRLSDADCLEAYGPLDEGEPPQFKAESMLCVAGDVAEPVGTCYGDSGGPLVARRENGDWIQTGVTSWGGDCGTQPSVFARVAASPLREWIVDQLPEPVEPTTPDPTTPDPTTPDPTTPDPTTPDPTTPTTPSGVPAGLPGQPPTTTSSEQGGVAGARARSGRVALRFDKRRREATVRVICASAKLCRARQTVTITLLGRTTTTLVKRNERRTQRIVIKRWLTLAQRRHLARLDKVWVVVQARALGSLDAQVSLRRPFR